MDFDPDLDQMINGFYRSAIEPEMWEACLETVNLAFGSEHTILFGRSTTDQLAFGASFGISAADQARNFEPRGMQLWQPLDSQVAPGRAVRQGEVISDREFERSDFYQELVRPTGCFYGLTAKQMTVDVPFQLTMCRPRGRGEYSDDESARLNLLLPHLTTAFELHRRLKTHVQQRQGLLALLDNLDEGAALADHDGKLLLINARAVEILSQSDEIMFDGDEIRITNPVMAKQLQGIIKSASGQHPTAGRMAVSRSGGRLPLLIRILPVQESIAELTTLSRPSVIIFFKEPDARRPADKEFLALLFNLTEREADIASLIATGITTEAIAASLGLTVRTVRWNLSAIYAKTGARTQTALAVLIHQLR